MEKSLSERKIHSNRLRGGTISWSVLASNCPQRFRERIISKSVPIVDLEISSVELGSMCGKPFTISALSIIDAGSSDIMSIREKEISNDRS